MIHNGFFDAAGNTAFPPLTPGTLAVVTVKPPSRSFTVPDVGCFHLTAAGDGAADGTTVALPAITTAADMEDSTAFRKPANQLNQNNFGAFAHIPLEGGTGQTPRFMSVLFPLLG